jgi:hypothetical protein
MDEMGAKFEGMVTLCYPWDLFAGQFEGQRMQNELLHDKRSEKYL